MKLTPKQRIASDLLIKKKNALISEVAFGGAAGGGKSVLGCLWLLDRCTRYPGSRWVMGKKGGKQGLKVIKQTTLVTFWEVMRMLEIPRRQVHYNKQESILTFPYNGNSQIIMADLAYLPSDPKYDRLDSLEITGAFIDGGHQVPQKARDILKSRIRYKLDEFGLTPKIFIACNPGRNWLKREFYTPFINGSLPEDKAFIPTRATDNKHLSKHYIKVLENLPEDERDRLFEGSWDFPEGALQLIKQGKEALIWVADYVPYGIPAITVDAARFGSDACIILVWSGWRVVRRVEIDRARLSSVYAIVQDLQFEFRVPNERVIVDEDGVGGGLVDMSAPQHEDGDEFLQSLGGAETADELFQKHLTRASSGSYIGFLNNGPPVPEPGPTGELVRPNYASLADQCGFNLADRINAGGLYFEPGTVDGDGKTWIEEQLTGIQRVERTDTKQPLKLRPKSVVKEELGASPDDYDALKMRVYLDLLEPTFSKLAFVTE